MENPHYRELRLVKQTEQHNAGTVPRFMSLPRECRGMAVAAHISSRLMPWHTDDGARPTMIDSSRRADLKSGPGMLTVRFRLLGLLPLIFFALHTRYYLEVGGLSHMLWMCNIGNLVLAIGLFLGWPLLIRLAVIWLLPGLPIWLLFVVRPGVWIPTSFVAHAGGLVIGLIAIQKVRAGRWTWIHALVWYLFVQEICRLVTPPMLNVNVAHLIYPGFETTFSAYWQFWIVGTLVVGVGLWIFGFALLKLFPPGQRADSTP